MSKLTEADRDRLDAAAFRRLLSHLAAHPETQNIDLMILAGFCRNCLADWHHEAGQEAGLEWSREEARERVYGMAYSEWKEVHQKPATAEQLAALAARKDK